jgi:mono/diheme cytochrome c family protein
MSEQLPYGPPTTVLFVENDILERMEQPTPRSSAEVERGAYLAEGLGHCGECHNGHNVLGASQWSGRLEGGAIEGWFAPKITAGGRHGAGRWSQDQLVTFLKTGFAPRPGVALGPMKETINKSLHYLTDQDLQAIAAYLKSLPGEKTYSEKAVPDDPFARSSGANAYLTHCALVLSSPTGGAFLASRRP